MGYAKYFEDIQSVINGNSFEDEYFGLIKEVTTVSSPSKDKKAISADDFKFKEPRCLPVILLLDTSKSMANNGKIQALNEATAEMLSAFAQTSDNDSVIKVSIITFGKEARQVFPLITANEAVKKYTNLDAHGGTFMGAALDFAKLNLIERKDVITSRDYRPTIILVSDGMPGDNWKQSVNAFSSSGRSSKCNRLAMGIGVEKGTTPFTVLSQFTGNDSLVFSGKDAKEIKSFFRYVTMTTIKKTVQTKASQNRDKIKEIIEEDDLVF